MTNVFIIVRSLTPKTTYYLLKIYSSQTYWKRSAMNKVGKSLLLRKQMDKNKTHKTHSAEVVST